MKIRIANMHFRHVLGNFPIGMELELPDEHAQQIINHGYAEKVEEPQDEPEPEGKAKKGKKDKVEAETWKSGLPESVLPYEAEDYTALVDTAEED